MAIVQAGTASTHLRRGSLRRPVDGASLAMLRIGVGGVAALSIARLWHNGWLDSLLITPSHHLSYGWFGWVPEPSPTGLRLLAMIAFLGAVAFTAGWHTRLGGTVFVLAFGWLELIEATTYLNHYWLLGSLVALLTLLPSGSAWSLDAHRGLAPPAPEMLAVWLLRAQVFFVYFFAGIAKLHHDWLVDALPLRLWLPSRSGLVIAGPLLEEPLIAHAASWAGAAFDLSVGFLLVFRRTRPFAFAALVGFHGLTSVLLPSIGLFPVLMTIAATVFFAPDWPRRVLDAVGRRSNHTITHGPRRRTGSALTALAVALVALSLTLPLRHWIVPGDARWTGEGYRLAWNVVAVEKQGSIGFWVDTGGRRSYVDPAQWFTDYQLRVAAVEPDLVVQVAHVIATRMSTAVGNVEIYADSWVSINGRPAIRMVDPSVDLTTIDARSAGRVVLPPPPDLGW